MSQKLPPFSAEQLLQSLSLLPPAGSWLVGLSGGADSTALLHAMVQVRDQLTTPFRAVHINHGLHQDSNQWQQHCETLCRDWSVPLTCLEVKVESSGQGLEAEAREQRYGAISSLLKPDEVLLTAHHGDDQAETLLLNLMRGSGVDGLSAMPAQKSFGQHQLQRPLLKFHHQAMLNYLDFHRVEWVEDPSNQNLNQDRNFIRNKVMPLFESQFPGTVKRLLLTQQAMAETRTLLEPLADQHLKEALAHPQVLRIHAPLHDNAALFKLVTRHWLKTAGVSSLPSRQLDELFSQLQKTNPDSQVSVKWAGNCLRFYHECLWLQKGPGIECCVNMQWPDSKTVLDLGQDLGMLSFSASEPFQLPGRITVTSRHKQPGLALLLGNHHQTLKNLFQTASIPAWLRDCVPLILIDGELAAVGDWATSKTFASWLSENHVKFTWQPNAPILQYLTLQQQHQAKQT